MRVGAPPGDSVEYTAEGAHDPTYLAVSRPPRRESLCLSQVDPPCDICRHEAVQCCQEVFPGDQYPLLDQVDGIPDDVQPCAGLRLVVRHCLWPEKVGADAPSDYHVALDLSCEADSDDVVDVHYRATLQTVASFPQYRSGHDLNAAGVPAHPKMPAS